jgi:putative endonuclease
VKRNRQYFVYIITNKPDGVLYVGMTNNLHRRISEHKLKQVEGFSKKYNLDRLVWFEQTENVHSAIAREKKLKNFHRQWKVDLIEKDNPGWRDLSTDI